jgi:hypothetical protein
VLDVTPSCEEIEWRFAEGVVGGWRPVWGHVPQILAPVATTTGDLIQSTPHCAPSTGELS